MLRNGVIAISGLLLAVMNGEALARDLVSAHPSEPANLDRALRDEALAARAQATGRPTASAAAPSSGWAGFYIGGGFSRNRATISQGSANIFAQDVTAPGVFTDERNIPLVDTGSSTGSFGLAGVLFQAGRFVFGAEGDLSFDRGSFGGGQPYIGPGSGPCGVASTGNFVCQGIASGGKFETLGHIRGIAGVELTPSIMGFFAAGVAYGRTSDVGAHAGIFAASSPAAPQSTFADSTSAPASMIGYSIGGGVQIKATQNILARFEYLRDVYNTGPVTTGAQTATIAIGEFVGVTTILPATARVVNESMRAALVYRFGPDISAQSIGRDIEQFTTAPGLYDNSWAGFYLGGGVTQSSTKVSLPDAGSIRITDNLGDTLTNRRFDVSRSGDTTPSFSVVLGYRFQLNRFLLGIERSFESSSFATIDPFGVGQFGGQGTPLICYPNFSGALPCVGQGITQTGFTTTGHLKLTGGVVVTPDAMAFVSGGYAYGTMPGYRVSTGGIVASPPSSPLVGAATGDRSDPVNVRGHTIGGGFEVKVADSLFVRAEYHHDWYEFNSNGAGTVGYGGTIGNVSTNSSVRGDGPMRVTNDSFKLSMLYRFWNPQNQSGMFAAQ